ncbi:GPCR family 3 C-terminal protein [Trinorchestia longiramus]|nr:GPCR family 3 C-terminal protein [Trinorchestia longiramus]
MPELQCKPVTGLGFARGGYVCECRPGYYRPNTSHAALPDSHPRPRGAEGCMLCPAGCKECGVESGVPLSCSTAPERLVRTVPLLITAAAIVLAKTFAFAITKRRKWPVIASSMWSMLLTMMLGACLIYCTVLVRSLRVTAFTCVGEQWLRETGFALYYGAIVLKLYRSLVQHRTRRAHRTVIRDVDLLKYLAGFLAFVVGYLAAGTAFILQLSAESRSLLSEAATESGHRFSYCQILWWEYVTEAGKASFQLRCRCYVGWEYVTEAEEMFFLVFGLYLAFQLRGASGRFIASMGGRCNLSNEYKALAMERRALTVALCLELLVSSLLYSLRHLPFVMHSLHPDQVFLLYFVRVHLTITVSMVLIIGPKLCCRDDHRDAPGEAQAREAATDLHLCEQLANGDIEINDISINQMDPEEIRGEMRRVYTQLEELRSKTMTKDNPHISKRRGGRKPTHRRFSLSNRKGSKDKSQGRSRGTVAMDCLEVENRTPEDSVCSIEGPSGVSVYADCPSNFSDINEPQISYKM